MEDLRTIDQLVKQIYEGLEKGGVDLTKYRYYPCIEERGEFRILGRPFQEFSELRRVVASNDTRPAYIFEPANASNPLKIIDPSKVL